MSEHDVFISYSKTDRSFVETIASELRSFGFNVWFDDSLHLGDDFVQEINRALSRSRMVLTVWSDSSVASRWVLGEAYEGFNKNRFAALRIDECTVPVPFNLSNYLQFDPTVDLKKQRNWNKLLIKLSKLSGSNFMPSLRDATRSTTKKNEAYERKLDGVRVENPFELPDRVAPEAKILLFGGASGAGTSNTVLSLAASLAEHSRVLVVDACPLGASIDLLLGIAPENDFAGVVAKLIDLKDAIMRVQSGESSFDVVPGRSGSTALSSVYAFELFPIIAKLYSMSDYDFILIDGSGMSNSDMRAVQPLADRYIVSLTDHPVSMTRVYTDIKLCTLWDRALPIDVIVNRAMSDAAGEATFQSVQKATITFFKKELNYLGAIPECPEIREFNRSQSSPMALPETHAYRIAMSSLADKIKQQPHIPRNELEPAGPADEAEPTMEEILTDIQKVIAADSV